jgi:hypothetical protein
MSVVRMAPELIATIQTGAVVRVVSGGVDPGSRVVSAGVKGGAGRPHEFVCEVDDGMDGDRAICFEEVRFTRADVALIRQAADDAEAEARPYSLEGRAEARGPFDELAARVERLVRG